MELSTPPNLTPEFGTPYDKARKGYSLASALLLAWEPIGIEISPEPFDGLHVTFKSPSAAPYILIAVVLYFGFRLTVEWYQAEPARRQRVASRADFFVAHALAVAAISLYVVQALLHVQVANKIPLAALFSFFLGFVASTTFVEHRLLRPAGPWMTRSVGFELAAFGLFTVCVVYWYGIGTISALALVAGIALSLAFFSGLRWFLFRLKPRRDSATPE